MAGKFVSDPVRSHILAENLLFARRAMDAARRAHTIIGSDESDHYLAACEAAHALARRAEVSHRLKLEEAA